MVKTVLGLLEQGRELRFVDDQHGCPTFTADLAPLLRRLGLERVGGIVHATNQRPVSWYGFVREILECAGRDPAGVSPITTEQLRPPRPAPRPHNSVLDNAVLRSIGVPVLPDFREPLERLVRTLTRQ
jgi:dTDP-4-dehydrorhamnose reductase